MAFASAMVSSMASEAVMPALRGSLNASTLNRYWPGASMAVTFSESPTVSRLLRKAGLSEQAAPSGVAHAHA